MYFRDTSFWSCRAHVLRYPFCVRDMMTDVYQGLRKESNHDTFTFMRQVVHGKL